MSKYLPKPSRYVGLGLSIPAVLTATAANSESDRSNSTPQAIPKADEINKQIDRNYPAELLGDGKTANPTQSPVPTATPSPIVPNGNSKLTAGQYTFILPTPALIAMGVVIGGLAIFPIVHLLLSSKKAAEIGKNSVLSKLADRFQKPKILESDAFLHQRNFEKTIQLASRLENLHAEKFGNSEFTAFFKIKSFISRSMGEYTNLDEIITLLKISIATQNSFATIDSTESRYCSSTQQELYKFVNLMFLEDVEPQVFKERVDLKLEEILPRLKTEEGKVVLRSYAEEVAKVASHPLSVKLLLSFKKYQLDDYSILRSISNTINLLESEDLLDLDALMVLVMTKYEVFDKLGPIVGVAEEYNRPETYSKMLQYIGLKERHEASYEKFQEFLKILKQWDVLNSAIVDIRKKYSEKDYRLPKDFTAEVPGAALYEKYKDSFHLITSPQTPQAPPDPILTIVTNPDSVPPTAADAVLPEKESPVLTGIR